MNFETPLSVALGEVVEWMNERGSLSDEFNSLLPHARPCFLKLGLAGLQCQGESLTAWIDSWMHVRKRFCGNRAWVAVAYADHVRAEAPSVEAVCAAAIASGCRVLLIDTFEKDGSNLFDFMSAEQLSEIRSCTAQEGLQLAVAGQITQRNLSRLQPIVPDIIAVRGAVCEGDNRTAAVSEKKVRAFLGEIESQFVT